MFSYVMLTRKYNVDKFTMDDREMCMVLLFTAYFHFHRHTKNEMQASESVKWKSIEMCAETKETMTNRFIAKWK